MNIRFLKTLIAVSENPTFAEAGRRIGLSHSGVSLHIKTLEERLQVRLVDRKRRPPALTDYGAAVAELAHKALDALDDISRLNSGAALAGTLNVGVVPSAATHLLPGALAELKRAHPGLSIKVRTGLVGDLIQQLRNREIDAAVATKSPIPLPGLQSREICREPLLVLAPRRARGKDDAQIMAENPFIWFSRKTHAGQKIERILHEREIRVEECMEAESFEAIEALVCAGLGVAVVPRRACAPEFSHQTRAVPLAGPNSHRTLVQIERVENPRKRQADELFERLLLRTAPDKNAPTAKRQKKTRGAKE